MVDMTGRYDTEATTNDGLSPGTYKAEIIDSKVEDISKTDDKGTCLVLSWKVVEGPAAGQMTFQRLMMWYSAPEKTPGTVAKIANSQWAQIWRDAMGLAPPTTSEDVHNRPCMIVVRQQKNNPEYTEIAKVSAVTNGSPPVAGAVANGAATQSNGGTAWPAPQ